MLSSLDCARALDRCLPPPARATVRLLVRHGFGACISHCSRYDMDRFMHAATWIGVITFVHSTIDRTSVLSRLARWRCRPPTRAYAIMAASRARTQLTVPCIIDCIDAECAFGAYPARSVLHARRRIGDRPPLDSTVRAVSSSCIAVCRSHSISILVGVSWFIYIYAGSSMDIDIRHS
jgi:hypothetical protein